MEEKLRITNEINLTLSLKLLATAYEEIAVSRIRLARDNVLNTREFIAALSEVFANVKSSYKKHLEAMQKEEKKDPQMQSFRTHQTNGKHVLVYISANSKLYGDIIPKVFHLFEQKAQDPTVDLAIVGKLGKEQIGRAHV